MHSNKKLVIAFNQEHISFNEKGEIEEVPKGTEIKGIFISNQDIEKVKSSQNKRFMNIKEALNYAKNRINNAYASEIQFFVEIISLDTGVSTIEMLMKIKKDANILCVCNNTGTVSMIINTQTSNKDTLHYKDELNFNTHLIPVDWFVKRTNLEEIKLMQGMDSIIKTNKISNIIFKSNIKEKEKHIAINTLKKGLDLLDITGIQTNKSIPQVDFEFYPTLRAPIKYQNNAIQVRIEEFTIEVFQDGMKQHLKAHTCDNC